MGANSTARDLGAADRQRRMTALRAQIKGCQRCPGLNIPEETESAPGYGSVDSPVMIVGQSLCRQCMAKQQPFYKGCGVLIDEALSRLDLDKRDVFATNVVHCHPPKNKPSLRLWKDNCTPFLHRELDIVAPRLVIALGLDAQEAVLKRYRVTQPLSWTDQRLRSKGVPDLWFAPHPSHVLLPWVQREHEGIREQYVTSLTRALNWSFRRRTAEAAQQD